MYLNKLAVVLAGAGLLLASCDSLFEERDDTYSGEPLAEFERLAGGDLATTVEVDADSDEVTEAEVNIQMIHEDGFADTDKAVEFSVEGDDHDAITTVTEAPVVIESGEVDTAIQMEIDAGEVDPEDFENGEDEVVQVTISLEEGGELEPSENHAEFALDVEFTHE